MKFLSFIICCSPSFGIGNPVKFVPNFNLRTCFLACSDRIDLKIGTYNHGGIIYACMRPDFRFFDFLSFFLGGIFRSNLGSSG